jgi:hypothetical protein
MNEPQKLGYTLCRGSENMRTRFLLLGFHQVLLLKMVLKFSGCCITLLLNFLYLCHQLLMLLSMLLLLPISEQ